MKAFITVLTIIITACVFVGCATGYNLSAAVVIDTDVPSEEYDPMIFGGFLEHFGRQVYGGVFEPGSPLSDKNGFRRDELDLVTNEVWCRRDPLKTMVLEEIQTK